MTVQVFYQQRASNAFDNLVVDAADIYRRFSIETRDAWRSAGPPILSRAERLSCSPLLPISARFAAIRLLTVLRLDRRWFHRFAAYWTEVLEGRPLLSADDFHFLRGVYRIRHQDNQVPDQADARQHVEAWQRPELIYQVFQQAFVEGLAPRVPACLLLRRFARSRLTAVLEFGCAAAPITTAYLDFFGESKQTTFYVSDMQTLAFHYAVYKFRRARNVKPLLLRPDNDFAFQVDSPLDAICCTTVLEHLRSPLAVLRQFHSILRPGGVLLFDYAKGSGEGLDTIQGVQERIAALDYIRDHFDIVHGAIRHEQTTELTVAVKRA